MLCLGIIVRHCLQRALVTRDGVATEVDCVYLVVGDIVSVKAGDRVPADIRIVSSKGLKVNLTLSSLTAILQLMPNQCSLK